MKRITALLLLLALLCSLTSCRSHEERLAVRRQLDLANGYTQAEEYDYTTDSGTTLPRQVLWQENGVTVTVLGIRENEYEYDLDFLIQNDTDQDLDLSMDNSIVNGWTVPGYGYAQVYPGGAEVMSVDLDKYAMTYVGEPCTIEGTLYYYDHQNYDRHEHAFTLTTSADPEDFPLDARSVWQSDELELLLTDVRDEGYTLAFDFVFRNHSRDTFSVQIRDEELTLNGDLADDLFVFAYAYSMADTMADLSFSVNWEDLEEYGIYDLSDLAQMQFDLQLDGNRTRVESVNISFGENEDG